MAGRFWWLVLGVGALMASAHVVMPDGPANAVYLGVGIGSVLVLLIAILRRPLAHRSSWALLGAGVVLAIVGDLLWIGYTARGIEPFPSLADVFYVGSYPLYAIGLWRMGRRERRADRGVLVDASILGIAGLVLGWTYLLAPYVDDSSLSILERGVSVAYPLGDLLLIPVIARLVFVHGARIRAHLMVLLAMLAMLVADTVFGIGVLEGWYVEGGPLDVLWLWFYVLVAAAVWHPSASHAPPVVAPISAVSRRRLVALAFATLLAPALLLIHDPPGSTIGWVAGVASMLLFLLVVGRMALLVDQVNLQSRQLEHLSRTDPLTDAANRRALDEALAQALARYDRDGRPFAFALLDLDHFKRYNDANGHLAGDALLREAVARWEAELREVDLLARFGGEEFAVVLPDADIEAAMAAVERLRAVVPDQQTCSAGIAVASPGVTSDRLVREADDALYVAKSAGRDRAELAASAS